MGDDITAQIQQAKGAGYSDDQIVSFLATKRPDLAPKIATARKSNYAPAEIVQYLGKPQEAAQPATEERSASDFFQNQLPQSASQYLQSMIGAVSHPVDTAKRLMETLSVLTPAGMAAALKDKSHPAQQLAAYAKDRYGSLEKASATAYHDPVGFLSDFSAVTGLGGEVADAAGMTKTANVLSKAAEFSNPVTAPLKAAGAIVPDGLPERMYQSALKPSRTNSLQQVKGMVQTGLREGIPVTEGGLDKLHGLIQDLNSSIKARIQGAAAKGATIDPRAVAQRVDQVQPKFAMQVNPNADLASLANSKAEFADRFTAPGKPATPGTLLYDANDRPITVGGKPATPDVTRPIPVDMAQSIKQGTYAQIKKSYGQLSSAQIEAQKALARGIKEELAAQFPEIADLNAKESKMIGLDDALESAVKRISNREMLGVGLPAAAGAAGLIGGVPAAETVAVFKGIIDNPAIKSKLAIAMRHVANRGGPAVKGVAGASNAASITSRIQDYVDGLNAQ